MGHINRTDAGSYRANWRDPAGRQRAKTFPTKKAAREYLAKTVTEMTGGAYVDPHAARRVLLADFAVRWLDGRSVEATTHERTIAALRGHVLPRWGAWPLSRIDHTSVQQWAGELSARYAPATVAKSVGVLSMILANAVRSRLIGTNPCDGVQLPSTHRSTSPIQTISRDHFASRLLPAVAPEHRPIVSTAAGTGMRWGECAGLAWDAVDLDRGELRVVRVAIEVAGRVQLREYPKSRAGVRVLPVSPFLVDRLRAHREGGDKRGPLVFATRTGTPPRRSNFRRQVWKPAITRSGLPGLRFHDLRHSYATWLISDGVPVNVVQRLMGHEDAATTLRRYVHPTHEHDDRVRDALAGLGRAADFSLTFEPDDLAVDDYEKGA